MSQTVFGTEMVLLTFVFCVIQAIFLFVHIGVILAKPYERKNWRFLLLVALFLCYNVASGLLPNPSYSFSLIWQNIFAYGSGIVLASYFYFFLVVELGLEQKKLFNVRFLVFSLVGTFLLLFVVPFAITGNVTLSKQMFIFFPVVISLYFCVSTIRGILKQRKKYSTMDLPHKQMFYVGNLSIAFMATMPVVVAFGDFQWLNNGLVNISFFLTVYAYYVMMVFDAKIEQKAIPEDFHSIEDLDLTPRETEVVLMMMEGLNYTQIGEEMYISNKTVSKHASNIFKKAECCSREEFLMSFTKPVSIQPKRVENEVLEHEYA